MRPPTRAPDRMDSVHPHIRDRAGTSFSDGEQAFFGALNSTRFSLFVQGSCLLKVRLDPKYPPPGQYLGIVRFGEYEYSNPLVTLCRTFKQPAGSSDIALLDLGTSQSDIGRNFGRCRTTTAWRGRNGRGCRRFYRACIRSGSDDRA